MVDCHRLLPQTSSSILDRSGCTTSIQQSGFLHASSSCPVDAILAPVAEANILSSFGDDQTTGVI